MGRGARWCWRLGAAGWLALGGGVDAAVRVLPLGDSITEGTDVAGSYRSWLWRELVAEGVAVDFVGRLSGFGREGGVAEGLDADHEGRWGWRADRVAEIAEAAARETRPDVVLVHLGHNDLWQGEEEGEVVADLEEVVGALRAGRPGVAVLLSTLVASSLPGLEGTAGVNARLPALVERLTEAGSPVVLVDCAAGFDPATMTVDGTHPNAAGARHLAAAWAAALRALLASAARMESSGPQLAPCPDRPSCVSSLAEEGPRRVEALRLLAPPSEAWKVAHQVLVSWPRVRLEDEADGYLRFSETSRWLGYVDDLELALDGEAGLIHVRSQSRVGYWDLGVNRRRVERLRRRLASLGMVESR